jgi:outer membrane protein TolC
MSRLTLRCSVPAVCLLLGCGASPLRAQTDTVALTLDDCVRMAVAQGPFITAARESYSSLIESYEQFRSSLLPQLSLQGQAPGYLRSISSIVQPDGTTLFTPQSQATSTLGLALSQQIPLTGGEFSILSGLSRIDLLEEQTTFYRSTPIAVSFRQPLFQLNTLWWNSEEEDLQKEIAVRAWVEAREDVSLDAVTKFFDAYLASMTVETASSNVAINDTLYNISLGRYNVGKIAENDLLQNELALINARTQKVFAEIEFERASRTLAFAIGVPKTTPLKLIPPDYVPIVELDPDAAVAQARANRSDMVSLDLERVRAERAVRDAQLSHSFSATLSASAGLNQRASSIPNAYVDLLDQQQLNVTFEVPLIQWGGGSAAVGAALAEQRRVDAVSGAQANDLEDEVYAQVKNLQLQQLQVGISAKADTIAQRRFEVSKDRYMIGKIDVTNLFLAQDEKDAARRSWVQTLRNYWSGYYRLRRLTLFDFAENRTLLERPER